MVDYSNIPRDSRRVPLETRVQFKFDRFSGFISEYSSNISPGGMFIRTYSPEPPGRILDFEFHLGDGFELIKGRGEVVWNRARDEGPTRPAGMGIRFLELSQGSKDLIYRIVDTYVQEGGVPFDLSLVPPDPVPAAAAPPRPPLPAAAPPSGLPAFSRDLPPEFTVEDEPFQLDPLPVPPPDLDMSGGPPPSWTPDLPRAAFSPTGYEPPPIEPEPELPPPSPAPPSFYLPEPSAPREEPPPLASYAGSASAPQRDSRRLGWLLVGLALVVLAAGLFLMRGRLLEWAGLGEETAMAQTRPARPRPRALSAPAATPAPADPGPAAQPTPVITEEEAAPPPASPAPEPAGPPAGALERITWERLPGGGTQVLLQGDGSWTAGRWTTLTLEGNPPREVIKLSGMDRPYPTARLVAGTPELLQVRTGYHPGRELHVVLDLANPRVQVAGVEPAGDQLRILLRARDSR